MKKIAYSLALSVAPLLAATDAQIIEFYKSQLPAEIQVSVEDRKPLDGTSVEYVSIKLTDGKAVQMVTNFTQGDYIYPEMINVKTKEFMKDKIEKAQLAKNISAVYKKESPKNILAIGNDSKKETVVIFTDPECPYCQMEMEAIEDRLKENNVKIIFTSVNDESSLQKIAAILNEAQGKSDAEKVKIAKKYYQKDSTVEKKADKAKIDELDALRAKYFNAGLKGVPLIINEKELL